VNEKPILKSDYEDMYSEKLSNTLYYRQRVPVIDPNSIV